MLMLRNSKFIKNFPNLDINLKDDNPKVIKFARNVHTVLKILLNKVPDHY